MYIKDGTVQTALCLVLRNNNGVEELLLAMKKRGFGVGKWNGPGGKFDPKSDKDLIETTIRETKEESGLVISNLKKVGIMDFYFPYVSKEKAFDTTVHVFTTKSYQGELVETEEMKPQWFTLDEIPYNKMWDSDKYWLPLVLEGKTIKAKFTFKEGETIDNYEINEVDLLR